MTIVGAKGDGNMVQILDLDDFPPGSLARTPSGRVGIVLKHKGAQSKRDHFQRVMLHFGGGPTDTVMLQPHLLEPIAPMTRDRASSDCDPLRCVLT